MQILPRLYLIKLLLLDIYYHIILKLYIVLLFPTMIKCTWYNNLSYSHILIGFRLWSLEDRRTIDVIITKFFHSRFKMAESFEN